MEYHILEIKIDHLQTYLDLALSQHEEFYVLMQGHCLRFSVQYMQSRHT